MNHHFRSYSEQLPNNNNNTINVNQNLINANNNGHTDRIIVHTNSQQSLEQLFNPDPETREKLVPLRQRNLPSSFFNPSNGRANNLHMRTQSVLAPMSSYQMQQQAPSLYQPSKSSISVHRLEQPLKSANLVASPEMASGNMGASSLRPDQQHQHLQLGGSQSDMHEHYYQNQQQINGGTDSSNNGSSHTPNGTNGTSATTIHNTNNNHHHRIPSQPLVPMIQPKSEQPIELGPNTNTISNNTHLPHQHHHHHHQHAPVASPHIPTATQFQCQAQQSQPVAQVAQILPVQQPQPNQHHHHRHAQATGIHQYGNYTAHSHHLHQTQQPRQNGHQYSSQQQSHQFGPQPHQNQHHNQAPYSQQPHQHSHYQQQVHYQPQPQHQQQPHHNHSNQHRYEQCANQFSDQQLQQGHLFQQHYPQG